MGRRLTATARVAVLALALGLLASLPVAAADDVIKAEQTATGAWTPIERGSNSGCDGCGTGWSRKMTVQIDPVRGTVEVSSTQVDEKMIRDPSDGRLKMTTTTVCSWKGPFKGGKFQELPGDCAVNGVGQWIDQTGKGGEPQNTTDKRSPARIGGTVDLAAGKATVDIWKDVVFTFPPVAGQGGLRLSVDGGWVGVAADGKSEITIVAELPAGVAADKADFRITSPASAAKGKAGGTLATRPIQGGKVTATYLAPSSIMEPFEITIEASVTDSAKQSYTGSVKLQVAQPPVVLVHGIWSNSSAWTELAPLLSAARFRWVRSFSYADHNNGDPVAIARELDKALPLDDEGLVPAAAKDKIMASKYDLVGHSLGGLIIRQFISQGQNYQRVRKVVTLGTPHLGSEFATWFLYFEKSRSSSDKVNNAPSEVKNHANWKNGYHSWTADAFDWLKKQARNSEKPPMDDSFFKYGPAVEALAINSPFLKQLNSDASKAHADRIDYYFLYGQKPLIPANSRTDWKKWGAEAVSWADNEVMIDTFFDHVTRPKTDGVVAEESAKGVSFTTADGTQVAGLPFKPKTTRAISANHNNITKEAESEVSMALEGFLDSLQPTYTYGSLHSPAHLHAYDSQNRHVGLDGQGKVETGIPGAIYSGPEEETGVGETIVIPGEEQVRFEVRGYEEGNFGLTVRRTAGDSDREVSFQDVPIKQGQTASLKLESGKYQQLEAPGGKVQPASATDRTPEAAWKTGQRPPSSADSSDLGWLAWIAMVPVGLALMLAVRRRGGRRTTAAASVDTAQSASRIPTLTPLQPDTPPLTTRFCGNCGKPVGAGARFCGSCGKTL